MEAAQAGYSSEGRMENVVGRRVMALVEDVEVARIALRWAVHNIFRVGDAITLLHVYPGTRSRNKEKQRKRRRTGFELALAFKDLCQDVPQMKVEIIVTEGEQGQAIVSLIEKTGASMLVLGIHEQSVIHRGEVINHCTNNLNCRVLAVKQPLAKLEGALPTTAEFSQIEICSISDQVVNPALDAYPMGLTWRLRRRRRRRRKESRRTSTVSDCIAAYLQLLGRHLCELKW